MRDNDPVFGDLAALRRRMIGWARKWVSSTSDADDLVQNALVSMWAARSRAPQNPNEIAPWAYTILLNQFRQEYRKAKNRPHFATVEDIPLAAPDNPETSTYCNQVLSLLSPLDLADLLELPRPAAPPGVGTRGANRHVALSETPLAKRHRKFKARQRLFARLEAPGAAA